MGNPPKNRLTAEERRASIIQAATRCIARSNFERCTTATIAQEAGITEALIYSHFKTKKELQLAVLESLRLHFLRFTSLMRDMPRVSLVEMRTYGKQIQQDINRNPDRVTVLLKAMAMEDDDFKEKLWEIIVSLHGTLEIVLEKAAAPEGSCNGERNSMLAWFTLAWGVNLSLINQMGKLEKIPEEHIDRFVEVVDRVVKAYSKTPA